MVHRAAVSAQRAKSYIHRLGLNNADTLPTSTLLNWLSCLIELVADVHREKSSVACLHLPATAYADVDNSCSLLAALACDVYDAAAVHVVCATSRYSWNINTKAGRIWKSLSDDNNGSSEELCVARSFYEFLQRSFYVPPYILIVHCYNYMEEYVHVLEKFKCGATSPSLVILVGVCSAISCVPTLPHAIDCEDYKEREPQLYLFEWSADCSSLELLKVYTAGHNI